MTGLGGLLAANKPSRLDKLVELVAKQSVRNCFYRWNLTV